MNKDFRQNTDDYDLDFSSGDIVMVESARQHQRDIILTRKGALKETPLLGVGIEDYLNDESDEDLLRKIRQQIKLDGQKVGKVEIVDGIVEVTGGYEENI